MARPRLRLARALAPVLTVALSLALDAGCTRRRTLTNAELARVERVEGGLDSLRVYPKRRLVAVHDEQRIKESYGVEGRVKERKRLEPLYAIITRNTPGQIVAEEVVGGEPTLWISWDDDCESRACAFGFVYTLGDRYLLMSVPEHEGYKPPRSYRGAVIKACRMTPGRVDSLSEANEVYRVARKLLKPLVLELQYKKYLFKRKRPRRRRATGRE